MNIETQNPKYQGTTLADPEGVRAAETRETAVAAHTPGQEYETPDQDGYAVIETMQGYGVETGTVRVKACLSDGTPLPGLPFHLYDHEDGAGYATGTSDASGFCTLEGVPRGRQVRLSYPRRHDHQGRPLTQRSEHMLFDLLTDMVMHEVIYDQPRLFGSVGFVGPWNAQAFNEHLPQIPELLVELRKNGKVVAHTNTNAHQEFFLMPDGGGQFILSVQPEVRIGGYRAICRTPEICVHLPADGCLSLRRPICYDFVPGMIVGQIDSDSLQMPGFKLTSTDLVTGTPRPVPIGNEGCFQLRTLGAVKLTFPTRYQDAANRIWDIEAGQPRNQTLFVGSGETKIAATVSYRQVTPQQPLAKIKWVVTYSNQRPAPGVLVKLCDPTRTHVYDRQLTSADGSCWLQPVKTGPHTILVHTGPGESSDALPTEIVI